MGPIIIIDFIVAGMCLAVALLHSVIYVNRPEEKSDLFFVIMAFCAAGGAIAETFMYQAASVAAFNSALRVQLTFHCAMWTALGWFIVYYTGNPKRVVAIALTSAYGFAIAINLLSPYGVLYTTITDIFQVDLAWGESITYANGTMNKWRILGDIGWLLLIYLAASSCVRQYRRGEKLRAVFLFAVLFFFLGLSYLHGTLVDLGIMDPPVMFTVIFLGLVLVMSASISAEVVGVGKLKKEMAENERRWKSLLQNIKLLVAGIDHRGKIDFVNPHFVHVTGFSMEDLVGKRVHELVSERDREVVRDRIEKSLDGKVNPHSQSGLVTKDGSVREILWSNVSLRDPEGNRFGLLSVGADMTDQISAEAARDRAIEELEALKESLEDENIYLREEIDSQYGFAEIVGKSNALLYVLSKIKEVAATDATVLVQGETGVGKELVARAIHQASDRSGKAFVRVNCAALPENLVEAELFGHESGAFTGAGRTRIGRFEVADGGTIFLDEISELPLSLQSKILTVLQEGHFERIGSSRTRSVDVRVITATNRNLNEEVSAGRFRADLFYRLNVYPITVPPLRSRRDDIPLLAQYFIKENALRMGKEIDQIPAHVMDRLVSYDWPGNVRELRNLMERAVIMTPGNVLVLPEGLESGETAPVKETVSPETELATLEKVEKQHLLRVLESTGWRISGPKGAAKILGLNPSTMRFRMKKLNLKKD
jgi:PAS domain S-box-containing protein